MALFSQRKGIKPLTKPIQRESLDQHLRNGLWNSVWTCMLEHWAHDTRYDHDAANARNVLFTYWCNFVKGTIDDQPSTHELVKQVKHQILYNDWSDVFDLLEFLEQHFPAATEFTKLCNLFFERENSAYRFVDQQITEITSPTEIETIEAAASSDVGVVAEHIQNAMRLLSDRKNPDYNNAIKEAISAVEGLCKRICDDDKATLAPALKKVAQKVPLHDAFLAGVTSLYGFTSDHGGIRHALKNDPKPSYSDTKFMIVLASAICGFLLGKCAEHGITLPAQKKVP